jgi:hypothetical protein
MGDHRMPTKEFGNRLFEIGVLKPETVQVYPGPQGAYYSLIMGENPAGETRSLISRGAGKQWGATRIPLQVSLDAAELLQAVGLTSTSSYSDFIKLMVEIEGAWSIDVLLVQMPREGNFVSGLEWNAPGGTQELDEAPNLTAQREFDEESGLMALWTGTNFPDWMQFASGCYDEVQQVSLALVTGSPTKLVEGARGWKSVSLANFRNWSHCQNQIENRQLWDSEEFCPVDGKVYAITRLLAADIDNAALQRASNK